MQRSDKVFNILHVVSKLPVGGVENMLLKIVKGYDKKRFNVSVCCLKEGGEIADELQNLGYKIIVLNKMKGHGFDWVALAALYKLLKRENIHILRTHQYHANLYGRLAGILAGVPVIIPSFHNLYESPNKPKVHRRLLNYFLSFFSDTLVAVSKSVASDMVRFDRVNPEKIKIIYNGIATEEFNCKFSKQEARKFFNLPFNSIIIGSVGRLTEQKGHRYLIEAVSKLGDNCIVFAGDGPKMEELKNIANRFKANCIFMGRIDPPMIPMFLSALDIFCFPSLWEGFGTAIIEAMVAELPIVVSDIITHKEVVGDAGIYFRSGDKDALAESLRRLMEDQSLRNEFGRKSKNRAMHFSIENVVRSYEHLFDEILIRKGML